MSNQSQTNRPSLKSRQGVKRPFADDEATTSTRLHSHSHSKRPNGNERHRSPERAHRQGSGRVDSKPILHNAQKLSADRHVKIKTQPVTDIDDDRISRDNQDADKVGGVSTSPQQTPAESLSVEERRRRRETIRAKYNSTQPASAPADSAPVVPEVESQSPQFVESTATRDDDGDDDGAVVDDMFASDEDEGMVQDESVVRSANNDFPEQGQELEKGLADNWDDPKGYYRFSKNEVLDGRYQLLDSHGLGKGMFSNVVRANDSETSSLVAIKIIRNNESMRKAAIKEMDILQKLSNEDPLDKKHLVRLHRSFTHKGHLCMVFENLSQDLRELLKKFGRDTGFDMSAIRAYARQLFLGLDLLKQCNVIHADLKPDNILASEAPHSTIKICDLGSAFDATEAADTPELASRFYRAPEVILGIPYDFAIDMWSIGCTLYELYTGRILFTGGTNNQMLHSIMECRGMLTERFVERGSHCYEHFELRPLMSFRSIETDPATGLERARLVQSFKKPGNDLKHLLLTASPHLQRNSDKKPSYGEKMEADRRSKELSLFADLLDKCLKTNPDQRIKPLDALQHAFFGDPKPDARPFQPAFRRPGTTKRNPT